MMNSREQLEYEICIPPIYSAIKADRYLKEYKRLECMYNPQSKEEVVCKDCESSLLIYRHQPRTGKTNKLHITAPFSTYKPQGLQACTCKALQVLVDHLGRVRIYTEDERKVALRFPLLGLTKGYIIQDLSLAPHITNWVDVDKKLVAVEKAKKFDYRFTAPVNHINLWIIRERYQKYFLPYPQNDRHQFYLDYAHTFKITLLVIVNREKRMYFQNGFYKAITSSGDFSELLLEGTSSERANELIEEAQEKYVNSILRKSFGMRGPLVSKKYQKALIYFLPWMSRMFYKLEGNYVRINNMNRQRLLKLKKYRALLMYEPMEAMYYRFQELSSKPLLRPEYPALLYYYDRNPQMLKHYLHLKWKTDRQAKEDYEPFYPLRANHNTTL